MCQSTPGPLSLMCQSTPGPLSLFCATALCKAAKSAAFCGCLPVSALECFSAYGTGIFFPNSAPLNSGLWLEAFGKVWLFRCQSGIRGLWLTAFGKSWLYRCQSRSFRPTFWLLLSFRPSESGNIILNKCYNDNRRQDGNKKTKIHQGI